MVTNQNLYLGQLRQGLPVQIEALESASTDLRDANEGQPTGHPSQHLIVCQCVTLGSS